MFWLFIYIMFFYETHPGFKRLSEKIFCKKKLIVQQKFLHFFFAKKNSIFFLSKISKKSFFSNFYNFLSTWYFSWDRSISKGLLEVILFVKKNDQLLNFKKKKFLNFFPKNLQLKNFCEACFWKIFRFFPKV